MLLKFFVLVQISLLLGCTPIVWVKPGANETDYRRDTAQCKYEATAATANYNTGPTARSISGAMAQGIGEGLAIALRQNELIRLCMQARDWTAMASSGDTSPRLPYSSPPLSQPVVPQQTSLPITTPLPSMPQQVPYQGERQLVTLLPQQQRKAKLDVVQVQLRYNSIHFFLQPDTHSEQLGKIYYGVNLKVIEDREQWLYVESPFGRRGWILKEWTQE